MKKPDWNRVLALLAAPCAAVAVAPYLGALHWFVDLLASFVVQALAFVAAASIWFALVRKWIPAATTAIFAAIAGSAVLPDLIDGDRSPQDGESLPGLRVATLNLLHSNEEGQQAALEVLRAADPDVIWFGEYTPRWQDFLQTELPDYPHRLERPDLSSFGAALYSRWPLQDAELLPGGFLWSPFGRAVVETAAGKIGVLGVHPPPPQLNRAGTDERDRGLAAIAPMLDALPGRRVVLGDFNATPWNDAFQAMRRACGLSAGSTRWWLPSWPDPLPGLLRVPIDHVLVGGDLTVVDARLGPSIGSDHRPVLATIRVGR